VFQMFSKHSRASDSNELDIIGLGHNFFLNQSEQSMEHAFSLVTKKMSYKR
jgi:hypothetical protein